MKRISIPADITVTHPITREPLPGAPPKTFVGHAVDCWLSDNRLGTTPKDLARVGKMLEGLVALKPGDTWELEDADFDKLRPIVEAPQNTYPSPLLNLQVLPFSTAFLEATDKAPVVHANGSTRAAVS